MKKSKLLLKNHIVSDVISLEKKSILAHKVQLVNVDNKGLYFHFKKDQIPISEKSFLIEFLNHYVELFLSKYELKFEGVIKSISPVNKHLFEMHIGFMESTPVFYRECVSDLMS